MTAAKMANLKVGENSAGSSGPPKGGTRTEGGVSINDAAKTLNVGERTVGRAKQVLTSGDQDLIDAVEQGKVLDGRNRQVACSSNPPSKSSRVVTKT